LTGGPRLSAVDPLTRARSLSRSLPSGADLSASVFLNRALSLYLSVSRARFASCRGVAPSVPLFSLYAMGQPCQFRLLRARRGPARAHSCTSPGFSATTPTLASNSLLIAPHVPRAHPSPHFAHPHPLSRSAHVASHRWRPTSAFSAIQLAGDCSKPPRALPRGETLVPMPNFPYCALYSANFAFAGARPQQSVVLARWPTDLAWFSSLE
jgi:hypothetical protein